MWRREDWPMSSDHGLASGAKRGCRWPCAGNAAWAMPVEQGIGDAGDEPESESGDEAARRRAIIWSHSNVVEHDQNQVDELDADERHDDAAEAVDQHVPAEDGGSAHGRYFTPRSASGISATMISALKMTALRIALSGE